MIDFLMSGSAATGNAVGSIVGAIFSLFGALI
ncbi:hypothetical protein SKPI104516_04510 [Skermania piniformis]